MTKFDGNQFVRVAAGACGSAARVFGFRNWDTRAGNHFTNPFPEVYATAEAVRLLRSKGFRVMPEVVVHEVLRKGGAGPGAPGKRGIDGRFDVTAWNEAGAPVAALELKWKWNSFAADIARLRVVHTRVGVRTFIGILAAQETATATKALLIKRVTALERHGVKVVRKSISRSVRCWEFEGGKPVGTPRAFAAAMVEIVPKPNARTSRSGG